jgi:predicted lactoylglutathione lyase
MFGVFKPHDGQAASAGNGSMIALNAGSPEKVAAMYEKAMALGAACEGKPGPRGDGGFYGAYFRDLDGNKIAVFAMG